MKKLAITIAIVLVFGLSSFAQKGGIFQRGSNVFQRGDMDRDEMPLFGSSGYADNNDIPNFPSHGSNDNMDAPLGGGTLLLVGLGSVYLLAKRRKS